MGTTQTAIQGRFAQERVALEARLEEQRREVEEERRKAEAATAAAAEREHAADQALAAAESRGKAAQELAAQVGGGEQAGACSSLAPKPLKFFVCVRCRNRAATSPPRGASLLQRAGKVEELAAEVKARQEALDRLDRENGANLLK